MGFIGMMEDYEDYKKSEEVKERLTEADINTIDALAEITEGEMKILRTTILRHDPCEVYMHEDPDFYETTYHMEGTEDDKELQALRQIRRVYNKWVEYDAAMELRNKYMTNLIDKYGGEELFRMYYRGGMVKEYIPPKPTFSKNAPASEYAMYKNGGPIRECVSTGNQLITELHGMAKDRGIHKGNFFVDSELSMDRRLIKGARELYDDSSSELYGTVSEERPRNVNGYIGNASADNAHEVQKLFRSWFTQEEPKKKKKKDPSKFFQDTPTAVKARLYGEGMVDMGNRLYEDWERGYIIQSIKDEDDPNGMVVDPQTEKVMTRRELALRNFITTLSKYGNWSEVKLMNLFDVGSAYERDQLREEKRRHTSSKRKGRDLVNEVAKPFMNDYSRNVSLDEIDNYLK